MWNAFEEALWKNRKCLQNRGLAIWQYNEDRQDWLYMNVWVNGSGMKTGGICGNNKVFPLDFGVLKAEISVLVLPQTSNWYLSGSYVLNEVGKLDQRLYNEIQHLFLQIRFVLKCTLAISVSRIPFVLSIRVKYLQQLLHVSQSLMYLLWQKVSNVSAIS